MVEFQDNTQVHNNQALMGSLLCFYYATISILLYLITAQTNKYVYHFCGITGNFTSNSTYSTNLNQLLSSLSSNVTTSTGYQNLTSGQDPDIVYGAFMCRGDVTPQFCKTCVDSAITKVTQLCVNQSESIIYFEHCMLRYSNQLFFSMMSTNPSAYQCDIVKAINTSVFNEVLGDLMNTLADEASTSNGSSSRPHLFYTKVVNFNSFQKIYGLVQCTPDVTPGECGVCLRSGIRWIPSTCDGTSGGKQLQPSCYLQYDVYPFYQLKENLSPVSPSPQSTKPNPSPISPSPKHPEPSCHPKRKCKDLYRTVTIVIIPFLIVLSVLLCTTTFLLCRRKRSVIRRHAIMAVLDQDVEVNITTAESLQFDFENVRAATDDFSIANKLGEGGFGPVYKGRLSDGRSVAVKRLSRDSVQGDEEFKNEVMLVAKLQHRNLVRLLGFCFEGQERLLIYEFVPNASLDRFIFDPIKRVDLNWETCYRIVGGIARGILYLHEDSRHRVIHRDLKASNILLDADMNPKISDFGMARLFVVDQTQENTSRIAGTFGYMAPEYAMHGRFSVKSDVYSFGVLLLEILTGLRNNSFDHLQERGNLLSYAWRHWKEGKALQLICPTLRASALVREAIRCIQIALLCVQEDALDRPTMGSVVAMLTSFSVSLALPSRPSFFVNFETTGTNRSHFAESEKLI